MVGVLALVLAFQSSAGLAYAFGMAVTGTFLITTLLYVYVARRAGTPLPRLVALATVLLGAELLVFAANLTKLASGAWLPLLIALVLFTSMTTWHRGCALVTRNRERQDGSLAAFVAELHARVPRPVRVSGAAVFLNRGKETPAMERDATYFLSTIELTAGKGRELAPWRKRLFVATSHVTSDAAECFALPRDRTVVMGSRIEI